MLALTLIAAQEAHPSGPLTVEGGLMIWTLFVFVLLLAILRKFAWPALLGAVEARERALEQQLAEAARDRAEAAALLAEHKKLVADARNQAHAIIAELLARARREIAAERERAIAELRREAVDLSLAAAGKLIGERLNADTDRRLVQDYLASLDARN